MTETLLTAKEAAQRARASTDTIKRALKRGQLRGYRLGMRGDWRVEESELRAWLAAGAKIVATEPAE